MGAVCGTTSSALRQRDDEEDPSTNYSCTSVFQDYESEYHSIFDPRVHLAPIQSIRAFVPEIATKLLIHPDSRSDSEDSSMLRLCGAILFIDMSGFTPLTERLSKRGMIGVEELSGHLNKFFGSMVRRIQAMGGDVLKFVGDALIVMFYDDDLAYKEVETVFVDHGSNMHASTDVHIHHRNYRKHGNHLTFEQRREILSRNVVRAAQCVLTIHREFHGYEVIKDLHLELHSAISCGWISAVLIGGIRQMDNNLMTGFDENEESFCRREFLIKGEPMRQLALASSISKHGEIVLTTKASQHLVGLSNSKLTSVPHYKVLDAKKNVSEAQLAQVDRNEVPKDINSVSDLSDSSGLCYLNDIEGKSGPLQMIAPSKEDEVATNLEIRNFIPANIISSLDHRQDHLLSELRHVTILFLKLPEQNFDSSDVRVRRAALDKLTKIVCMIMWVCNSFGGNVRQLVEDDKATVMILVFGLREVSDKAARGVKAALLIAQQLDQMELKVAIGVTTGDVFCGTIGNPERREYCVIGDSVNTSARLMGTVPDGNGILCDEVTRDEAMSKFHHNHMDGPMRHHSSVRSLEFKDGGSIKVKGKDQRISIFKPFYSTPELSEQNQIFRFKPYLQEECTGMVGRMKELETIGRFMKNAVRMDGKVDKAAEVLAGSAARSIHITSEEGAKGAGKRMLLVASYFMAKDHFGYTPLLMLGNHREENMPFHAVRTLAFDILHLLCQVVSSEKRISHMNLEELEKLRDHEQSFGGSFCSQVSEDGISFTQVEFMFETLPHDLQMLKPLLNFLPGFVIPENQYTATLEGHERMTSTIALVIGLIKQYRVALKHRNLKIKKTLVKLRIERERRAQRALDALARKRNTMTKLTALQQAEAMTQMLVKQYSHNDDVVNNSNEISLTSGVDMSNFSSSGITTGGAHETKGLRKKQISIMMETSADVARDQLSPTHGVLSLEAHSSWSDQEPLSHGIDHASFNPLDPVVEDESVIETDPVFLPKPLQEEKQESLSLLEEEEEQVEEDTLSLTTTTRSNFLEESKTAGVVDLLGRSPIAKKGITNEKQSWLGVGYEDANLEELKAQAENCNACALATLGVDSMRYWNGDRVAVVVENIHHIDSASMEFLGALRRVLPNVLLIVHSIPYASLESGTDSLQSTPQSAIVSRTLDDLPYTSFSPEVKSQDLLPISEEGTPQPQTYAIDFDENEHSDKKTLSRDESKWNRQLSAAEKRARQFTHAFLPSALAEESLRKGTGYFRSDTRMQTLEAIDFHPRTLIIRLSSFTDDMFRDLLRVHLDADSVHKEVVFFILQKSGKDPIFAGEIIKSFQANDVFLYQDVTDGDNNLRFCSFKQDGKFKHTEIPVSLQASITTLIDRLKPDLKLLLKVCSIIGQQVSRSIVEKIYPVKEDVPKLGRNFKELVNEGFLVDSRDSTGHTVYIFKRFMYCEVAYKLISFSYRALLHKSAAVELLRVHTRAGDVNATSAIISHHWQQVVANSQDDNSKYSAMNSAIEALIRTAKYSALQGAHAATMESLEAALDLIRQLPDSTSKIRKEMRLNLLVTIIPAALVTRGSAKAVQFAAELDMLPGSHEYKFLTSIMFFLNNLERKQVDLRVLANDVADIEQLGLQSQNLVDRVEARHCNFLYLVLMGEFDLANKKLDEFFEEAFAFCADKNFRDLNGLNKYQGHDSVVCATNMKALCLFAAGNYSASRDTLCLAFSRAEETGHKMTRLHSLTWTCTVLTLMEDYNSLVKLIEDAVGKYHTIGTMHGILIGMYKIVGMLGMMRNSMSEVVEKNVEKKGCFGCFSKMGNDTSEWVVDLLDDNVDISSPDTLALLEELEEKRLELQSLHCLPGLLPMYLALCQAYALTASWKEGLLAVEHWAQHCEVKHEGISLLLLDKFRGEFLCMAAKSFMKNNETSASGEVKFVVRMEQNFEVRSSDSPGIPSYVVEPTKAQNHQSTPMDPIVLYDIEAKSPLALAKKINELSLMRLSDAIETCKKANAPGFEAIALMQWCRYVYLRKNTIDKKMIDTHAKIANRQRLHYLYAELFSTPCQKLMLPLYQNMKCKVAEKSRLLHQLRNRTQTASNMDMNVVHLLIHAQHHLIQRLAQLSGKLQ